MKRQCRAFVVFVLYLIVSSAVFYIWSIGNLSRTKMNDYHRAYVMDMIHGEAHRPFVYRMMVPLVINGVTTLTPDALVHQINTSLMESQTVRNIFEQQGWEEAYAFEYLVLLILLYGCLLGFVYALRKLLTCQYEAGDLVTDLCPAAGCICLLPFFDQGTHFMYDMPTILFSALLFLFMAKQKWVWYYAVFTLACLNRETFILFTFVFACYLFARRRNFRAIIPHIAAQALIYGAIRIYTLVRFRGNPGSMAESHFTENIQTAISSGLSQATILILLGAFLVLYRFRQKPLLLRIGLLLLVPLVPMYFLYGSWGELRVFYEVFTPIYLLSLQTVAQWSGWKLDPREIPVRNYASSSST